MFPVDSPSRTELGAAIPHSINELSARSSRLSDQRSGEQMNVDHRLVLGATDDRGGIHGERDQHGDEARQVAGQHQRVDHQRHDEDERERLDLLKSGGAHSEVSSASPYLS